ncbi:hypothetical protein CONPUDRAFT_139920 [Coniophora puteana RWD-64-598 SS2]|uniref:DUF6534 domain-containing protein n=1 Tax=Coniophora puteana (strain RWD-64-598) TaxID=741705 RepID=A0A5M3MBJ2_CONPW|nr:uncharacterized protein CONPUDRAFT_139920 [Coniophora puteana RWD-64-598 SS2]EIW76005.1 hypothetical protein CONPUDRAFT_139920 [Coniophora puteana RWD-64-598 SS2]
MVHNLADSIVQGPLCGTLATMFLYGINCIQTFFYVQNYSKDRWHLKLLVAVIMTLETAHTILSIHYTEYYLIENFGNDEALGIAVWSLPASFIVGFLLAFIVEIVFIWRVWRLCFKLYFVSFLVFLAIVRLGLEWANSILNLKYRVWETFRPHVVVTLTTRGFLAAFLDALIASALCYYLHKLRTGMKRTDSIINWLVFYAINTGAITSLVAISVPILVSRLRLVCIIGFTPNSFKFLRLPTSLAFTGVVEAQSKLYAVSLLASLNSRRILERAGRSANTFEGLDFDGAPPPTAPTINFTSSISVGEPRPNRTFEPAIELGPTETHLHADSEESPSASKSRSVKNCGYYASDLVDMAS